MPKKIEKIDEISRKNARMFEKIPQSAGKLKKKFKNVMKKSWNLFLCEKNSSLSVEIPEILERFRTIKGTEKKS